eukprot:2159046-Prymnesium_polylepis.1
MASTAAAYGARSSGASLPRVCTAARAVAATAAACGARSSGASLPRVSTTAAHTSGAECLSMAARSAAYVASTWGASLPIIFIATMRGFTIPPPGNQ